MTQKFDEKNPLGMLLHLMKVTGWHMIEEYRIVRATENSLSN